MKARIYWVLAALLYCGVVYSLLWRLSPPYEDLAGVTPGLDVLGFGPPSVGSREYYGDWTARLHYRLPYLVWALVFTLAAGAANGLVGRIWCARRPPFASSFLASLLFLLIGPLCAGWTIGGLDSYHTLINLTLFVALSVLSGLASVGYRLLVENP